MQFLIKIILSAVLIASVSEIAKRFSWIAAILASLPITSILALTWLYIETKDVSRVSALSRGIFWAAMPSIIFFLVLPLFLQRFSFGLSLFLSCGVTALGYLIYVLLIAKIGIRF